MSLISEFFTLFEGIDLGLGGYGVLGIITSIILTLAITRDTENSRMLIMPIALAVNYMGIQVNTIVLYAIFPIISIQAMLQGTSIYRTFITNMFKPGYNRKLKHSISGLTDTIKEKTSTTKKETKEKIEEIKPTEKITQLIPKPTLWKGQILYPKKEESEKI